jgi:DNA-binding NarL/FixJ family response regulator
MGMTQGAPPEIRVVVIDDHVLVAEALERAMSVHPRIRLIGRAGTAAAGLELVDALLPDLVVMDFRLPDTSGIDATRMLRRAHPDIDVVMLTGFADGATLAGALEAGCAGFVSKQGRFDELLEAIVAVHEGQVKVPSELLEGLVSHLRPRPTVGHDLTSREREVLRLLAAGLSTSDMVDNLVVSVHTVRNHVRNLLVKLHASSRLEAVAVATRANLLAGEA